MASRGTQCGNPKWIPRAIVSPLLCPCLEIKTPQTAHAFIECSRDAGLEYISCGTWMRIMKGIYASLAYNVNPSIIPITHLYPSPVCQKVLGSPPPPDLSDVQFTPPSPGTW